jgi:vacuolar-type H+-ATPase subunit H
MARLGDILRRIRFRFHGVPGAPSLVGVPADITAELEVELAPVFAALAATQQEAARLDAEAGHAASQQRAEAHERARRLVAAAQDDAERVRAEATAGSLAVAAEERRRVLAAAEAEADRIARVAAERTDVLVEQVVAHVLSLATPTEGGRIP